MAKGPDAYTSWHNICQWSNQSSDPATELINNLIRKQFWGILVVWVKGCFSEDWSTGKHMTWPFLQPPESMGGWSGKILVTWGQDEQFSPQHKTIDRQSISPTARETRAQWVSLTRVRTDTQTCAVTLRVRGSAEKLIKTLRSWFVFQRTVRI